MSLGFNPAARSRDNVRDHEMTPRERCSLTNALRVGKGGIAELTAGHRNDLARRSSKSSQVRNSDTILALNLHVWTFYLYLSALTLSFPWLRY